MQCRLHLNHRYRDIEEFLEGAFAIYSGSERRHITRKRKSRSDKGDNRGKQRRKKFPAHFTEAVQEKYAAEMISAYAAAASGSSSEDDGEAAPPSMITDEMLDASVKRTLAWRMYRKLWGCKVRRGSCGDVKYVGDVQKALQRVVLRGCAPQGRHRVIAEQMQLLVAMFL